MPENTESEMRIYVRRDSICIAQQILRPVRNEKDVTSHMQDFLFPCMKTFTYWRLEISRQYKEQRVHGREQMWLRWTPVPAMPVCSFVFGKNPARHMVRPFLLPLWLPHGHAASQSSVLTLLTSGYDLILKTEVSLCVPSWQVGVATTDWKQNCQPSSRLIGARGKPVCLKQWPLLQAQSHTTDAERRSTIHSERNKEKIFGCYSNNGLKNYY